MNSRTAAWLSVAAEFRRSARLGILWLYLASQTVAFRDLSNHDPDPTLIDKPSSRIGGAHPPKYPLRQAYPRQIQDRKKVARNAPHIRSASPFVDVSSTVVEPPRQKVFLVHPIWRERMISNSGRLVTQPFARGHESATELSVLTWPRNFTARTWPQVGAKESVLFKHLLAIRHVSAVRSLTEFIRLRTIVENCRKYPEVVRILAAQPWGSGKGMSQERAPSGAGPFTVIQASRQILQPCRLYGYIVVGEGENITPCFPNSPIECK